MVQRKNSELFDKLTNFYIRNLLFMYDINKIQHSKKIRFTLVRSERMINILLL